MRATFEHAGTIVDIGTDISGYELDNTSNVSCGKQAGTVCVAVYQRELMDETRVTTRANVRMKPSEARAMASAMLSAATEARA